MNRAVGFDELHRSLVGFARNFREAFSNLRILRGKIFDRVASDTLPPFYPERAKAALPIINQQRFLGWCSDANGGFHPADIIRISILHQSAEPSARNAVLRRPRPRNSGRNDFWSAEHLLGMNVCSRTCRAGARRSFQLRANSESTTNPDQLTMPLISFSNSAWLSTALNCGNCCFTFSGA